MSIWRIASFLVPALCLACRGPVEAGGQLCERCRLEIDSGGPLRGSPPAGLDDLTACAAHEDAARALLAAFKFGRLIDAGKLIAAEMASVLSPRDRGRILVPVPPSRRRQRFRGFDPAGLLACQLAAAISSGSLMADVIIRVGSGRQRGRGRAGRLATPPAIEVVGELSGAVLLVDDVVTTGATLSACAAALRLAGATSVSGVAFTRRL